MRSNLVVASPTPRLLHLSPQASAVLCDSSKLPILRHGFYKEAFALFDKRGNGRVALESLGDLLRACGQNPTLVEISDLEQSVGGDCKFTHSQ